MKRRIYSSTYDKPRLTPTISPIFTAALVGCPPLTPTISPIFTAPLVGYPPPTPTTSPIFTAPLVGCPTKAEIFIHSIYAVKVGLGVQAAKIGGPSSGVVFKIPPPFFLTFPASMVGSIREALGGSTSDENSDILARTASLSLSHNNNSHPSRA